MAFLQALWLESSMPDPKWRRNFERYFKRLEMTVTTCLHFFVAFSVSLVWNSLVEGPTGGALGPGVESDSLPYVSYSIEPEP